MDVERFARELPALFEAFPSSPRPRGRRFADLLEAIGGLACENNLALLNLAAALVEPGESYVEAGSFKGLSLAAALRGNDVDAVGIDRWSLEGGGRDVVLGNLARLGLPAPTLLDGDYRDVLGGGGLEGRRVGVWYYDAAHDYESQLDALLLVEPHLAERALLVVDDADWERVAAATRTYLEREPRARLVFDIPGKDRGHPHWWSGVHVLAFERAARSPSSA